MRATVFVLCLSLLLAGVAPAQDSLNCRLTGCCNTPDYACGVAVAGSHVHKVHAPSLIGPLSASRLVPVAAGQTSWWRTYGGESEDKGYSVQQTTDGGYIIAGHTYSLGAGYADVYLVKTDSSGDTLWTRAFGGADYDWGNAVQQTTDGGYIVTGSTESFGAGVRDVYLIKTDAAGDTLWTRTYGGTDDDCGDAVQQTTDGGYIVTGYTYPPAAWSGDVILIKTNAQGDTLWTRTYGGSSHDEGSSVQQTGDGGYIIAGCTYSFGSGAPYYDDVYLIRTDAQGDTFWTRTYGADRHNEVGFSVRLTSDSGYIITGYCPGPGGTDVYLIKTDSQGDTLWTRTYGCRDYDQGESVQQTFDGGYIIAGYAGPYLVGNQDVYLVKTDASGDTLWTRTYGGQQPDEGFSVQQTADSGYIIAGFAESYGAGGADVYLIKTDADGNAPGVEEPLTRYPAGSTYLLAQPNPFTSVARVPEHETELFALTDVTGRQVAVCKGDRIGAGLRPGVYFLSPVGPDPGKPVTVIKAAN
jgi:hypothetical protein